LFIEPWNGLLDQAGGELAFCWHGMVSRVDEGPNVK